MERLLAEGWSLSATLKRAQPTAADLRRAAPLRRERPARFPACSVLLDSSPGDARLTEQGCRRDCSPPRSARILNQIFITVMIGSREVKYKGTLR
jgi:hypothetical protein